MSFKIAIDARKLAKTGVGVYIRNIVQALARLDRENEYLLLVNRKTAVDMLDELPSNFRFVKVRSSVFSLLEQIELPLLFKREKTNLFHSTHFFLPMIKKVKSVVTVHDLIPILFPEYFSFPKPLFLSWMIKRSVNDSDYIIAVSGSTQEDIKSCFGDRISGKTRIIYEAVGGKFNKMQGAQNREALKILGKHELSPKGYMLYVGPDKKHKNIDRLIEAFNVFGKEQKSKLVLAGNINRGKIPASGDIILTGVVNDEELRVLYENAQVFVFPSLYEGFGLPLLEAMAHAVPVITSNLSAMAEIAGDAALLVDPYNVQGMATAMRRILDDEALRKMLVEKGLRRVEQFSWEKNARETLSVYRRVINASTSGK